MIATGFWQHNLDREILIEKLYSLGIQGLGSRLVDKLSDRQQIVEIKHQSVDAWKPKWSCLPETQ